MADDGLTEARVEAERVARDGYGRLLAFLASRTHDVAVAEDALADAFAAALAHWPVTGVPRVPEAWLLVTARRRMSDEARRRRVRERDQDRLLHAAEEATARCAEDDTIPDERLQPRHHPPAPRRARDAGTARPHVASPGARPGATRIGRHVHPADGAGPEPVERDADRRGRAPPACASELGRPGRFQLEAAVQSAHAARRQTGRTDWPAILGLYDALLRVTGSIVVAINRAVALAAVEGPGPALAALDRIAADQRIVDYQPYWAARADILAQLGRSDAVQAYERALGLTTDDAVRDFLVARRAAVPDFH